MCGFFCPLEPVWGDIGTWASTFATAVLSLIALRLAGRDARRLDTMARSRRSALCCRLVVELHEIVTRIDAARAIVAAKPGYAPEHVLVEVAHQIRQVRAPALHKTLRAAEAFEIADAQMLGTACGVLNLTRVHARTAADNPLATWPSARSDLTNVMASIGELRKV